MQRAHFIKIRHKVNISKIVKNEDINTYLFFFT